MTVAEVVTTTTLKGTLKKKIEAHRPRTTKLVKEFGKVVIEF